jgi:O-antigen/teichoic acid export membrane protein
VSKVSPTVSDLRSNGPRSFAHDSAVLLFAQIAASGGYLIASLELARNLGQEGRGSMAFVVVTVLVVATVARLGTAEATVVLASARTHDRPVLLSSAIAFGTAGAAIAAGLVSWGLLALGSSAPAQIGRSEVMVMALGIVAMTVFDAGQLYLLGCGRLRERAFLTGAVPWLYAAILGLIQMRQPLTVELAAVGWLIGHSVGAVLLLGASIRVAGIRRPERTVFYELFVFGLRGWLGNLASFLNFRVDQILMGFISTSAALGVYAVAVNGSEILLYLPGAVATALVPSIARSGEPDQQQARTLRSFRLLLVLTLLSGALVALAGTILLPVLFGRPFEASVGPFLALLPGAIGYAASRVFAGALFARSRPGRSSVAPLMTLAVGVLLDVLLIPALGALGAAIAASVAFLAGGALAVYLYRTHYPFSWVSLVPTSNDVTPLFGRLARNWPVR